MVRNINAASNGGKPYSPATEAASEHSEHRAQQRRPLPRQIQAAGAVADFFGGDAEAVELGHIQIVERRFGGEAPGTKSRGVANHRLDRIYSVATWQRTQLAESDWRLIR